ncbi:hypothetical protein KR222_001504 [Zaprionus bogoriensis]|nr:hypothetical protein KR222_001504 [Zaprionus bogoriensis]
MDVLLQRLEAHCVFSAYADDLLLLVEGGSRLELERTGAQLIPLYADLRHLDGLGVRNLHGNWSVSGAVQTYERMRLLCAFAGVVFRRRRHLQDPLADPGLPVPS